MTACHKLPAKFHPSLSSRFATIDKRDQ